MCKTKVLNIEYISSQTKFTRKCIVSLSRLDIHIRYWHNYSFFIITLLIVKSFDEYCTCIYILI